MNRNGEVYQNLVAFVKRKDTAAKERGYTFILGDKDRAKEWLKEVGTLVMFLHDGENCDGSCGFSNRYLDCPHLRVTPEGLMVLALTEGFTL